MSRQSSTWKDTILVVPSHFPDHNRVVIQTTWSAAKGRTDPQLFFGNPSGFAYSVIGKLCIVSS